MRKKYLDKKNILIRKEAELQKELVKVVGSDNLVLSSRISRKKSIGAFGRWLAGIPFYFYSHNPAVHRIIYYRNIKALSWLFFSKFRKSHDFYGINSTKVMTFEEFPIFSHHGFFASRFFSTKNYRISLAESLKQRIIL